MKQGHDDILSFNVPIVGITDKTGLNRIIMRTERKGYHYPVYKGETEAQAYKRKLAEEEANKNDGTDTETDTLPEIR